MAAFDHREIRDHYATLLASIYGWMLGDFAAARDAAALELRRLGVAAPVDPGRAIDLGAGLGPHAVALAELGYAVTAIDGSAELLTELARVRPDVTTICADLLSAAEVTAGPFDVIVCMGDTLTHLSSLSAVAAAFASVRRLSAPNTAFVLSFRDYTRARHGADRCFLVRADAERILTCCLQYEELRVEVTDILHERIRGEWQMRASAYHKLRLSLGWVRSALESAGFGVTRTEEAAGWLRIVAHPSAASPA